MAIDIYDYFHLNANRSGVAKPATIYSVTKIDKGDDTSLLMNAGLYLSPTAEDDYIFPFIQTLSVVVSKS